MLLSVVSVFRRKRKAGPMIGKGFQFAAKSAGFILGENRLTSRTHSRKGPLGKAEPCNSERHGPSGSQIRPTICEALAVSGEACLRAEAGSGTSRCADCNAHDR